MDVRVAEGRGSSDALNLRGGMVGAAIISLLLKATAGGSAMARSMMGRLWGRDPGRGRLLYRVITCLGEGTLEIDV